MSVTLDPRTALLVVDMQKGILSMPPAEVVEPLVQANRELADALHTAGLPVVWIHATGLPAGRVDAGIPGGDGEPPADFTEIHDDLPTSDGDHHVFKDRTFSAFPCTGLDEYLQEQGVTEVVVTGIATGAGVESTARSAYDAGYHVVVVSDAVTDPHQDRHEASLSHALPGVASVAVRDDVLTLVNARRTLQAA